MENSSITISKTKSVIKTPLLTHISPKLNSSWSIYYHLPNDKKWDSISYKLIMEDIDNTDKIIGINEMLPEEVVKICMLFVMRRGIAPLWEDPQNRSGGSFSYKIPNKNVYLVWRHLFYALGGETLCINKEHQSLINGISVSPKKNFCIIKIWLKNISVQDPNIIIDIPNLDKKGCIFTAFQPEF